MAEEIPIVSIYSRKQAIEDGVLIDVSEQAKNIFKLPIVITETIYRTFIDEDQPYEEQVQKLLFSAVVALNLAQNRTLDIPTYEITRIVYSQDDRLKYMVKHDGEETALILDIGPGDTPEPVYTLMMEIDD